MVSLAEEGRQIVANLRHLALKPHPCYRDGHQVDPVNLYHKVSQISSQCLHTINIPQIWSAKMANIPTARKAVSEVALSKHPEVIGDNVGRYRHIYKFQQ